MDKSKYVCCICMQKSETLLSLNAVDDNNVEYIKKLSFCVPQQTWTHTYQICDACTSQLNVVHNFVLICLESERFRKEELNGTQEGGEGKSHTETSDVNFKCHHCGKSFRQKKYLRQHLTKLHVNKRKKEDNRKNVKKEREEVKVAPGLLPAVESIGYDDTNLSIKEEETFKHEITETMSNNGNLEAKVDIKCDPSDMGLMGGLGDTTDALNDENDSAESEIDDDDDFGKCSVKKKGSKKEAQKCSFCDEVFLKRHEWATHIRTKHTFQKPFSCDLCDARYMNGYSLLIHKRKHTNEKPFICATCGKSFVSSADLNHHNKIHDSDRAYPCPMCERSFKTHSNLRTHRLQMHLDPADWKFSCHLCDKKFPIRGNLVKHLKRHAGIKEFNCHICGKQFVNKAELTLHLNTHTNQRLFKCKLCGKDYKNREGLRRHMKVVHDQGNWKAPKCDKKHSCPMCPKIFAFGNKLQRHIFTHTGEKPFKCDYCQKRFIDNYGRKVHYKKDHNVVDFYGL